MGTVKNAMWSLLSVCACQIAGAQVFNGNFESGDLSGWIVDAPIYGQVPVFPGQGWSSNAAARALVMNPGDTQGYLAALELNYSHQFIPGETKTFALEQDVFLHAGQSLTGEAGWSTVEYEPGFDFAWVRIRGGDGSLLAEPWFMQSPCGRPPGAGEDFSLNPSNWSSWIWNAPVSGTYRLELGIGSYDEGGYQSAAYFDNISIVPEPNSFALLALALLPAARRRFKPRA